MTNALITAKGKRMKKEKRCFRTVFAEENLYRKRMKTHNTALNS